jgi:hypothetical protein
MLAGLTPSEKASASALGEDLVGRARFAVGENGEGRIK